MHFVWIPSRLQHLSAATAREESANSLTVSPARRTRAAVNTRLHVNNHSKKVYVNCLLPRAATSTEAGKLVVHAAPPAREAQRIQLSLCVATTAARRRTTPRSGTLLHYCSYFQPPPGLEPPSDIPNGMLGGSYCFKEVTVRNPMLLASMRPAVQAQSLCFLFA